MLSLTFLLLGEIATNIRSVNYVSPNITFFDLLGIKNFTLSQYFPGFEDIIFNIHYGKIPKNGNPNPFLTYYLKRREKRYSVNINFVMNEWENLKNIIEFGPVARFTLRRYIQYQKNKESRFPFFILDCTWQRKEFLQLIKTTNWDIFDLAEEMNLVILNEENDMDQYFLDEE